MDYCNEEGLYEGTKTITKKAAVEVVGVSEYIIEEGETVQFEYHVVTTLTRADAVTYFLIRRRLP